MATPCCSCWPAGLTLLGVGDGDFLAPVCRRPASASRRMPRRPSKARRATVFRTGSRQQALRWKEFALLRRDPWLVSQSLMQLLYLVPPALMLWRSFADGSTAIVLITPVVVMAAGQLSGGLAWLTISCEDAADLVATRAAIGLARDPRQDRGCLDRHRHGLFAPLIAALAFASPAAGCRDGPGRGDCDDLRHRDPALVPGPGPAQPIPPASDLVADCDLRGSLFVDRLGLDRGAGAGDPGRLP